MELSSECFLFLQSLRVGVLEIIQEFFEQIDTLKSSVANTENRTDYLRLHLAVYQDYVSLVENHISHF
jgi:hypothetical protein